MHRHLLQRLIATVTKRTNAEYNIKSHYFLFSSRTRQKKNIFSVRKNGVHRLPLCFSRSLFVNMPHTHCSFSLSHANQNIRCFTVIQNWLK
jgi:hypothetical protein